MHDNNVIYISFDEELLRSSLSINSKYFNNENFKAFKGISTLPNFGLKIDSIKEIKRFKINSLWYVSDDSAIGLLKNKSNCEIRRLRQIYLKRFINQFNISRLIYIDNNIYKSAFRQLKCNNNCEKCSVLNSISRNDKKNFCYDPNYLLDIKNCSINIFSYPALLLSNFDSIQQLKLLLYELIDKLYDFKNYIEDKCKGYFNTGCLNILFDKSWTIDFIPIELFVDAVHYLYPKLNKRNSHINIKSKTISFENIIDYINKSNLGIKINKVRDSSMLTPFDLFFADMVKTMFSVQRHENEKVKGTFTVDSNWFNEYSFISHIDKYLTFCRQEYNNICTEIDHTNNCLVENEYTCGLHRSLRYYVLGNGQTIFLLSPITSGFRIWQDIVYFLSKKYRVILLDFQMLKEKNIYFGYKEKIRDIYEIMIRENIKQAHFVGWCSGATDALVFSNNYPDRVLSLTLMSGRYSMSIPFWTESDNQTRIMAQETLNNPKIASMFVRAFANAKSLINNDVSFHKMVELINRPCLKYSNYLNEKIMDEDGFIRYCEYVLTDDIIDVEGFINQIKSPCLIITGERDNVTYPCQSIWIAGQLAKSDLVRLCEATHWIIIENAVTVANQIDRFIIVNSLS